MDKITAWPDYMAPPGSRYTVVYSLSGGTGNGEADFSNRSIVRQILDSRPGVDVFDVKTGADGRLNVELIILREGPILSVLGNGVYDGSDRYWTIESVFRTDSGAGSELTAGLYRFADWITDPFDRIAEEAKRTGVETAKTTAMFGIPTALLAGGAFLVFVGLTR